jgi:hypothetical protein
VAVTPATQQDTWDHIFGAGAASYDWWASIRAEGEGWDFTYPAPDGWGAVVEVDDPEAKGTRKIIVNHKLLMGAIRAIAFRKIVTAHSAQQPTAQCVTECRNFLFDRDATDFDAATADEVLQVATLGAVHYG